MAVLTTQQRVAVRDALMHDLSRVYEACALNKVDLQAAIDAADTWVNSNAASYNSALPAAAQAGLTAAQKARILAAVALKRFGG